MPEEKKEGLHFTTGELRPDQVETEEQCFMRLDRLGDLLNSPGSIQYEASIHPIFGSQIKEQTNKMLHAAVDGVNFDRDVTDECMEVISDAVRELQQLYLKFISEEIGQGCVAMQILGINKLLVSLEEFSKAKGVTPEIAERLKAALAKMGKSDRMIAARPHPSFGKILQAGIHLAGGQEKFALRQASVLERMPDVIRGNPNTSVPAQTCGAIIEMITSRACTSQMMVGTIVGTLETVLAAKRFTTLTTIADWEAPVEHIAKNILLMAEQVIMKKVDAKEISAGIADQAIEKMMKSATQPGNETKH